jgi:putative tricarboxylic transport membrane protein
VITCIDGYQMARQGRAGPALAIAAIGSFFAGTVGTLGLMLLAPPLAAAALYFGPPEYFSLVLVGLTALSLVGGGLVKGLMMGLVGLMIATIGVDPQVGNTRFMFGQLWLMDGIDFLVLAVALFGIGEVLASVEQGLVPPKVELTIRNLMPTRLDFVRSRFAVLRGTVIGFLIGVLPGAGATIASFIAYAVEKKVSKHPEQFGTGAVEGVAAPEAANNAAATGAMVPMFALGIPGSGTTAVMLGALIMFGLQPGPQLFEKNASLVWGVIASMYVGNFILLALNLPLAGMFATLLRVRYALLYPVILALCIAGVYSQANSADDLWVMSAFGVVGYWMKKYGFPVAPLVLGLVLEPMLETALRQSMTLSHGSLAIFVTRPISAALIVLTLVIVLMPLFARAFRRPPEIH